MAIADKLNNGGGLYDNAGLCDTLIADCNNVVKQACAGQYIQFCNTIVQMVQKLANLKNGIQAEAADKDKTIEELKRMNSELIDENAGLLAGKGAANGTD